MEFNFREKPTVRICGKDYEFDPSNNSLLEGVVENFPKIVALAHDFQDIQRKIVSTKSISSELIEKNTELTLACRDFIIGCLGQDEYNEIFSKRRPNSSEHVELCTFLYRAMMDGREDVLNEYLGDADDPSEDA